MDPRSRRHTPDFYGYISSSRSKAFRTMSFMLTMTISQMFLRVFSAALLAQRSMTILYAVLGVETSIFLWFKAVQGELRYFIPLYGCASWALSVMSRITVKVVMDFLANVHVRGTYEAGGAYFTFNLVFINPCVCFFMAHLYLSTGDSHSYSASEVYICLATLYVCLVLSFFSLLRSTEVRGAGARSEKIGAKDEERS